MNRVKITNRAIEKSFAMQTSIVAIYGSRMGIIDVQNSPNIRAITLRNWVAREWREEKEQGGGGGVANEMPIEKEETRRPSSRIATRSYR